MSTKMLYPTKTMQVEFRINDDFSVELVDVSPLPHTPLQPPQVERPQNAAPFAPIVELHCTGESTTLHHGRKHNAGSMTRRLRYDEREEYQNNWGKKLEIKLDADNGLRVVYHMQFFVDVNMVRTWAVVTNESDHDIGLESVSSFTYHALCQNGTQPYYEKSTLYIPYNSWTCEAQWQKRDLEEVGLSRMVMSGYRNQDFGINRFTYGNTGSWSSCEYLPMGMLENRETGEIYYWQIESSGTWHAEYGSTAGKRLYLSLHGPTEAEGHWWKNLKPGQSFTTVPAAFGAVKGGISEAAAELTKYRRAIRRLNEDNFKLHVVFNDFMNCLEGDPTEEAELALIDQAAALGCEVYCVDAGWYADGAWWDSVGEWQESNRRFPGGLRRVFDHARSKGLKRGIWLEPEVIGVQCPLAQALPDDWFFQRHGKRHIDHGRYLLDFRNPAVQAYATALLERLMDAYGIEYFKLDYNVTTGIGTEYQADSAGDGLLEHTRALYAWYDRLYAKYPHLILENCGSGGQRMDYGMLQRHSLQSITDQTDVLYNSCIAANAASAVTPEQAGIWVYPYQDDAEHVIYNMVSALLLRPTISGQIQTLSAEPLSLLKEGVALYKEIRRNLFLGTPFFPLGFAGVHDDALAYGIECRNKAYLAIFGVRTDHVRIPLSLRKPVQTVQVLYPSDGRCTHQWQDGVLEVTLPQTACARLFALSF